MKAIDYLKSKKELCDSFDDCLDCPFDKKLDLPGGNVWWNSCTFMEVNYPDDALNIVKEYLENKKEGNNSNE